MARPRKPGEPEKKSGEPDLPKIPSQYKKDKMDIGNLANFKSDVDIVTVDVSVLDNKGHFIPGIPAGNFRILEDNVPQQIRGVNMGEAPMTVSHGDRVQQPVPTVLELQRWYQTLQASLGFH